jgi:hypothetical protein
MKLGVGRAALGLLLAGSLGISLAYGMLGNADAAVRAMDASVAVAAAQDRLDPVPERHALAIGQDRLDRHGRVDPWTTCLLVCTI